MAPAPIRSAVGPSTAPIYPRRLRPSADQEYRPFPNEEGRNSRQGSLEVPLMIRALGLPAGGRVLEVGCGRGVALPVLARRLRPSRLVGLDLDIEFLEEARSRLGDAGITAELVPGDVRRMPFPEAAFDLVVDFGTCYHIARPQAALAEIARVLAPGGLFTRRRSVRCFPILCGPSAAGCRGDSRRCSSDIARPSSGPPGVGARP
jgi:ubiquinone/menaquinone biosynthesis C-methylase UbiE